jgi:hypothetical protein
MRWVRGVIAFAAAGVLGAAALRVGDAPEARAVARVPLVSSDAIDSDRVSTIILERDGVRHVFERRGASWQQTEPVRHAIDGWSMRQLIGRVLKAESVRTVELAGQGADDSARQAKLAEAGLAPPAARIELREEATAAGAAPRTVVVELGRRSLAGRAYGRLADGSAAAGARYSVIDAELHEYALGRDPKEFRRRDLFVDLGAVDRLALHSAAGDVVVVRDGRNYRIDAPVRTRADRVQVEELLDAVRRAKSGGFVSDRPVELSAYGLEPAGATLEVDSAGTRRTLLIGDAVSLGAQDRFGMLDGTTSVVRLPAAVLAPMIPRLERLLDAVASGIRSRDIAEIEIALVAKAGDDPAVRLTLRREAEGWSAALGRQGEAESVAGAIAAAAVEGLLKALTETRASAVEVAPFPTADLVATVSFIGFAREPLDTVRIARRAGDERTILENGDGVLRLHGAIELPLTPQELGFRATR